MRKLLLLLLSFGWITQGLLADENQVTSEESQGDIVVFQGKKKIKADGRRYTYALAKGDKVLLKFSTEKEKKLKNVRVMDFNAQSIIWEKNNIEQGNYTIDINKESIYCFDFFAKSMGSRKVSIDIVRVPGAKKDFNTAYMKYNTYAPKEVIYSIDSMIGYKEPVVTKQDIKIFNKYYYQNVELFNHHKQILGQGGIHNSQGVGYSLAIDPAKVPQNAKFKCYTYTLSSVLGGAKHWAIADAAVSAGALFLSPAASFAAHGAMGIIGPEPGNEPLQYYMSNRESDIRIVKEIYSLYNEGRKATNTIKDGIGEVAGVFSGKAKDAVKGTKVKSYGEGDLSFNQKGKITNMFVSSATPPMAKYFIMGNPDVGQARNTDMNASVIYYAPTFRNVKADIFSYELNVETLEKTKTAHTKTSIFGSIND
ncbi:hypothetical protein DMA11_20425 [Marinilabiliaceae bacterium JC017]|nr:hypothetical protein DMA11_20425 [Marinilabiliaceae bacterium JC017]